MSTNTGDIQAHLLSLLEFFSDNPTLFLLALGLLFFANSSIMIPSSEALGIAAGFIASTTNISLGSALIVSIISNHLGATVWYLAGYRRRLTDSSAAISNSRNRYSYDDGARPTNILSIRAHINRSRIKLSRILASCSHMFERLFQERGAWPLMLLRNVPGLRAIISYPAGTCGIRPLPYTLWSLAGISIWVTLWTLSGYLLGLSTYTKAGWLTLLILATFILVLHQRLSRLRKQLLAK
jgi:membrane protein DedA with SNARE-associated domain